MQLVKLVCEKCSHSWLPRVENPLKCPKCGHIPGTRVYKTGKDADTNGRT